MEQTRNDVADEETNCLRRLQQFDEVPFRVSYE